MKATLLCSLRYWVNVEVHYSPIRFWHFNRLVLSSFTYNFPWEFIEGLSNQQWITVLLFLLPVTLLNVHSSFIRKTFHRFIWYHLKSFWFYHYKIIYFILLPSSKNLYKVDHLIVWQSNLTYVTFISRNTRTLGLSWRWHSVTWFHFLKE